MKLHTLKKVAKATVLSTLLSAQLFGSDSGASFSIETDPSTFAFNGYALHLKKSFEMLPQWQFGLGVYAMDFPDALVDMEAENANKGWDQRLEGGVGVFIDYFTHSKKQEGLFIGAQFAQQRYKITKDNIDSEYGTFLAMAHIGYQYTLYEGLYIKPWIGVGYNEKIWGENSVKGDEFKVVNVAIFPTVHIGYKF